MGTFFCRNFVGLTIEINNYKEWAMPQKFPYTTMSMFSSKYWNPLHMEAMREDEIDKVKALNVIENILSGFIVRFEYTDDYKMYVKSRELENKRIYGLEVNDTYYKLLVKDCFEAIVPFDLNAEIEFTDFLLGETTVGNRQGKEVPMAIKNLSLIHI